jgi:hypothetical protein
MAQDLTVNIKTTSDVPQAMDKAKSATVSFSKQVDDIGKKFSMAFKDIAFAFVAPLVIVNNLIGFITDAIAKAKQDAQEGLALLAKGKTMYATDEEKKAANFFAAKKRTEDEKESVLKGRAELSRQFMNTPEGSTLAGQYANRKGITDPEGQDLYFRTLAHDRQFQDEALKAFLASAEGKAYQPIFDNKKDQNFKGPEGFSNVVGVGANPVMESMTAQLEEVKKTNMILERIAGSSGYTPQDFTKGANNTTASPSRSYLLTK